MAEEDQLPKPNKGILAEFWDFILHEKVWWMTPLVVFLLIMVGFITLAPNGIVGLVRDRRRRGR